MPCAEHASCSPFRCAGWILRVVDFDNDSLFMNDLVVGWCRAEGLEVTRSRAYRKNDQAPWAAPPPAASQTDRKSDGGAEERGDRAPAVGYGRF